MGGSVGGSKSESGNRQADKIADKFFGDIRPLERDITKQLRQVIKGGTPAFQIPVIAQAIEQSKHATSQALTGTEESLASQGLAGTPFGENILAQTRIQGEMAGAQQLSMLLQDLFKLAAAFAQGQAGTAAQASQGAGTTQSKGAQMAGGATYGGGTMNINR